jgi:hypothetical protein
MTLREHATKVVDYSIHVAWISIIMFTSGFCAWWFIGFPPGGDASEMDPISGRTSHVLGIAGYVFLFPAHVLAILMTWLHIPSSGVLSGVFYFVASFILVSLFWGTVIYALVQAVQHLCLRRKEV